jgi:hypothetical protein
LEEADLSARLDQWIRGSSLEMEIEGERD